MSIKVLFDKNGTTGTTGDNTNPLPATNNADAKGLPIYNGFYPEFPIEFAFTKSTVDCTFAMEGTLDGTLWSTLAFVRCDTGATVASVALTTSARFIVKPVLASHLHAIRPVAYTSAGAAVGDVAVIRAFLKQ